MRENFYLKNSANYPRIKTDVFFADYENRYIYGGFINDTMQFAQDFQLMNSELWRRFVQQFREDADYDAGWRGEYWGKMMRGACFVYSYTRNQELYKILTQTVEDMLESTDEFGRISSYGINHEFDGWDMWSRKYVLLGMQYFLEICTDFSFAEKIVVSMCKQVDYIMTKIGPVESGKKPITSATRNWRGLNASSILEPIVRLYNITGKKDYYDFAQYIVESGGADIANVFELAFENNFYPYQYPVTKVYEMTSCFEGLLEFYRINGDEKYKTALINYANSVLESDFTVIGCSGCTHELFDHSTVRQTNTTNDVIQQETCVTVTLMKFFYQLTLLTGDPKYVDAFEISLYNAYLGSVNTEKVIEPSVKKEHSELQIEPLPFDSYSPLTAGTRGNGIGGFKIMSDGHYYGCCACIGSAGIGLVPKMQLLTSKEGFALNLFIDGKITSRTPSDNNIIFDIKTNYPIDGRVDITVHTDVDEEFVLFIRNPQWSKNTSVSVNFNAIEVKDGYISIKRLWKNNDTVILSFDMRTEALYPIPYGTDVLMNNVMWDYDYVVAKFDREDPLSKKHIALRRGPVMLAQDNRLGYSVDDSICIKVNSDGYVDVELSDTDAYKCLYAAKVSLADGSTLTVTDYASAGKLWTQESKMAVWMLTI